MDAAALEEMNRVRVSLGMKPLPVPGADTSKNDDKASDGDQDVASTIETRQAQAMGNLKKLEQAEAAKAKRDERAAAVRKAREKAQRFAKLEGKGLGEEEDGGDTDAKSWLMGQKKRQKKIDKARKLEQELAAAEAAAAAAVQYTSKDLAGIKVAHDMSSFLDGDEQVLTLKDTAIGADDDDDDELENLGLRENEKLADRLDLKKKKPTYDPNDDDGEGGILAQYDEEIDGKKTKNFTLDANGTIAELSDILSQPVERSHRQNVNIDDIVGDAPMSSDYLAASEIKIKKPKKKKSKHTRQRIIDEDEILEATQDTNGNMDVDSNKPVSNKRKTTDDTFVDDEDLQASLALQRRNVLKKRKRTRPEDIARQLKNQEEDEQQDENSGQGEGLVIGEVSEFVSGLSKPEEQEERKPRARKATTKSPEFDEDQPMTDSHYEEPQIKEETPGPETTEEGPVDEEKTVGEGMGAALKLLRERGLVQDSNGDELFETFRDREEFLSRKRMLEEELDDQTRQQRERDRMSGKLDKMSTREREEWARQQNVWRDQQQSRKMAELYSQGYKPKVQLKYTDEHGRELDQKEAFKHLSHHFHGKGSGKGKTEKRLKKIGDEKRREAQSMFDANQNGGMNVAAAQQLKKRKEAGVRLG